MVGILIPVYFEIKHIRGRENIIADALSRVPGVELVNSL